MYRRGAVLGIAAGGAFVSAVAIPGGYGQGTNTANAVGGEGTSCSTSYQTVTTTIAGAPETEVSSTTVYSTGPGVSTVTSSTLVPSIEYSLTTSYSPVVYT
jgi:hypothetical protein